MRDDLGQTSGGGPEWTPEAIQQPTVGASPAAEPLPAPTEAVAPAVGPNAAPTFEPAMVATAATAPVEVRQGPRPSRARWAIAGVIALVIVALSAAGLFALAGASGSSQVAAWAPKDSIVYTEVRGDLPGDQRQNLGSFLAHFPGFADRSSLDAKLDEAFDRIVQKGTNDKHDWTKEIKPWFGGQVGLSVSNLPSTTAQAKNTHVLFVASQKDPAAAIAWTKSIASGTSKDEAYQGATLTVFDTGNGVAAAATATGGVLLIGDEASVKSAVDRGGKDGLPTVANYKAAMSSLSGDQLSRTYVDMRAYFTALKDMAGSLGGGAAVDAAVLAKLPDWFASGTRVDSDAISGELVAPVPSGTPKVVDKPSEIAKHVPATTLALLEAHDVGTTLQTALAEAKKQTAYADSIAQVEQAAALLGGLDNAIGWIGDVGIVVTSDGTTPGGGLVIVPTDPKKADQFSTQVKNLLALAGGSSGVTVKEEPYGSGTITTLDFGDINKLMGGSASVAGSPLKGNAELSFTSQGGVVVIGVGPAWVKSIVDVKPGSSLADQARYKDAMARVGASNASSLFVDIAATRALVEPLIKQLPDSNYATEVKPYVAPFDVLAGATSTNGANGTFKYVLTVTKPQ
jgi:Protein of unknown function (DUF3352)